MKDYVIFTDATCDLPSDLLEKMEINVIPMEFQMDGVGYVHYPDARQMSFEQFYSFMREGKMSTTSQINLTAYEKYFTPVLQSGKDILYIGFSSALSGTFQASLIASQELNKKFSYSKVVCVDSLAASVGEGFLVCAAAQKKKEGLTIDELALWLANRRNFACQWLTVDTLTHLRRGGRISPLVAVAGTALGIKPVMHIDKEGKLTPALNVRGRKNALNALVDKMEKTIVNPKEQTLIIGHADCKQDALELKHLIKEKVHPKDIIISNIGPVIGSHTGPGLLALVFFGTEK